MVKHRHCKKMPLYKRKYHYRNRGSRLVWFFTSHRGICAYMAETGSCVALFFSWIVVFWFFYKFFHAPESWKKHTQENHNIWTWTPQKCFSFGFCMVLKTPPKSSKGAQNPNNLSFFKKWTCYDYNCIFSTIGYGLDCCTTGRIVPRLCIRVTLFILCHTYTKRKSLTIY